VTGDQPSPRLQPSLKLPSSLRSYDVTRRLDKTVWQASDEQNNEELRVDVESVKAPLEPCTFCGVEAKMM
jgi:hypothetical protein